MKKYTIFFFLIFITNFLLAEDILHYGKDEWEWDYNNNENNIEEKELFDLVESQNEKQEENNENNQKPKNNYFTKMYIESAFNWKGKQSNNYLGKINSYILASYYEAFLGFSSTSKNSLALRFSPILMHYPKKRTIPVLSLYLGNFNTPITFRHIYNPLISTMTVTSNRKFFLPLNSIKIAKAPSDEGVALELSLPFFNFYSFWKNTKKGNIFNSYASYKNNFSNISHLNIAILSSIQEIKKKNLKKNAYIQIYGLNLNFSHPIFYINSSSLLSILPKRILSFNSFAFRNEFGFTSSIASLHSGISYKGAYYLGNQKIKSLLQRKSFFTFYLQGKLKYKIVKLNGMYHLIKDFRTNSIQHSFGFFYSLGNSFVSYKNELFYRNEVYKLKFAINIIPHLAYFKLFNVYSFLYLEDMRINPKMIKKYEIATKTSLNIAKYFLLTFSFLVMQEKKNFQRVGFLASSGFTFNFRGEKTKEKGEIKLKYNSNKKNNFEIDIKFRLEY